MFCVYNLTYKLLQNIFFYYTILNYILFLFVEKITELVSLLFFNKLIVLSLSINLN